MKAENVHSQLRSAAVAADSYGKLMYHPTVTWSVVLPLAGTVDASGAFTAGSTPGEYPDAVLAESGGVTAHAGVVVVERVYRIYLPVVARGHVSPSGAP